MRIESFILVMSVFMLVSGHVGAFCLARYARRLASVEGRQVAEAHHAGARQFQHALERVKRTLALGGILSLGLLLVLFATGSPYPGVSLLVVVMGCAYLSVSVLEKGTGVLANRLEALRRESAQMP